MKKPNHAIVNRLSQILLTACCLILAWRGIRFVWLVGVCRTDLMRALHGQVRDGPIHSLAMMVFCATGVAAMVLRSAQIGALRRQPGSEPDAKSPWSWLRCSVFTGLVFTALLVAYQQFFYPHYNEPHRDLASRFYFDSLTASFAILCLAIGAMLGRRQVAAPPWMGVLAGAVSALTVYLTSSAIVLGVLQPPCR